MTEAPWYRVDPAALDQVVQDALVVQPRMRLDDEGDRIVFRGRFDVREDGAVVEAFAIDLVLPDESPRGIPSVWEVGGRIPRVVEPHHVNDADGSLCVVLPEAFWFTYAAGLTLAEYLEEPLRRHLAGQAMVLRGKQWPVGEWDHGANGRRQFYRELFGITDDRQLVGFFKIVGADRVKGHWICPCGSGKKLRQCHVEQVYGLRDRIPPSLLEPFRGMQKRKRKSRA